MVDIFQLYRRESEPFEIGPDDLKVKLKFVKRTEAQRRECEKYAREKMKEAGFSIADRKEEIKALVYGANSRDELIELLRVWVESHARAQGLDLFDNVEPNAPDAPQTQEELDEMREERLKAYVDKQIEKTKNKSDDEIRDELAEYHAHHEYGLEVMAHHIDMALVQMTFYADTGEKVFGSPDDLGKVQPETIRELRDKMEEFLTAEGEKAAREAANHPNS